LTAINALTAHLISLLGTPTNKDQQQTAMTGYEALQQIAAESGSVAVESLVIAGTQLLSLLRDRDIILGTQAQ
jgi:hypothetical protein